MPELALSNSHSIAVEGSTVQKTLTNIGFTWVAIAFVLANPYALAGTLQEPNFTDTVFVSDATRLGNSPASGDGQVNGITSMVWAPDGSNRLYVTVKGRANANAHIQVINNGVLQSVPFYTFNAGSVYTNNECGLMSMVFHPDYASGTKQIYCFITVSNTEQRVVRFTETISGGNYIATGAPTTIVSGIPTQGQNHNGGGLTIAPDQNGNGRFLYWACGNNGNGANVGERFNNANLGCKIGRANLDGSTPTDGLNASGLIWAYGYRNPFTMTTQPATGKLWVNVVGDGNEQIFMPTPGSWAGDNDFENFADPNDATLRSRQIKPIIKYRTNGTDTRTIGTASRSGSTVTYITTSRHGFRKGEKISISGVSDASFNGSVYVLSDVNDTTFTATLAGAGASGTGGSAVTQSLGGCITGGGFNDKGVWPAAYGGNYFFGDYNSGRITRVQLNGDNSVRQVDSFMTGGGRVIDVSFGPDGNLYYGIIDQGTIRRISYNGLAITNTSPLPASTVGVAYSQTLGVTGATAPNTWAVVTGALPSGLSLNASTGAITGTPTGAGTSNFTVRVTDSTSKTGQKDFSITINAALSITTASPLPNGTVGVAYNQTFAATGGTGTKTWSVSAGTLPGGLSLNTSSGALTGSPTGAGTSNFTIQVRDGVNATGSKAFALTITTGNSAPTITSTAVTTGNSGVAYTYDVNASGNPVPTYSLTTFPTGMTINTTSGVISWTPGSTVKGNFNVTVVASNGVNPNATQSFTINVLDYGLATRPAATAFLGLNTSALPSTLSATNVFSNVANLTAGPALIPYSVNSPLWSDNAGKARWIAVPTGSTIGFAQTGEWTFPSGTVLVKHFDLNTDERNPAIKKRLETRLLFVQNDGTMFGATYKWRADNTNADLLPDGLDENITITTATGGSRTQTWHYPSRAECLQCHTQPAGGVLGVKTRQQNGTQLYPTTGVTDNQLRTWNHIGLFTAAINEASIPTMPKLAPLTDSAASLETRVRSYIDSNCSQCHRPAGAPALFDARFDTPLAAQGIINGAVNNEFGVAGSKVVVPQDLARSLMHRRVDSLDAVLKMPPLAKNLVDAQAVSVIAQWIGSLAQTGSGLYGVYYDNMDFTGTSVSRTDPVVDFDWGNGAPIAGIGVDTFSVRWTGQIQIPTTGTYTFFTTSDDGVRLRVNGQLLVDKFIDQGPTEWSGTIALTAGQKYDVLMEYYENGGGAVARLNWSGPGITKQTVPQSVLYPVTPPAAPGSLIAVASSSTQINLTWVDNANNESGYEIQRSPDGAAWATITTSAANATSYSNTGLTAATMYHYRLRAVNFAGVSAFAGPVSTTTMSGGGPGTPSGLRVNFQLAGGAVPAGYAPDYGAVFGDRGNGFSYGWNLDNSATARDRNSTGSADQRYDTLQHLQKPENPNGVWEIALVNGTYSVRVVSGDPSHIDSVFKMNVEGQLAVNGTPTTTQRWFEGTVTVNLTDGRLTITNGAGAANNKICFVDITPVASSQIAVARELGDAPAESWVFENAGETAISTAMLFTKPKGDALKVKAKLPGIPAGTALAGQVVGVDVGGAVLTFTLDAKGRAKSKQGSCKAVFDKKSGDLIIQLSVRKGEWNQAWADGGVDKTLTKADVVMPFVISFGERRFGGSDTLKYVGRKQKTGRAK